MVITIVYKKGDMVMKKIKQFNDKKCEKKDRGIKTMIIMML